MILRAGVLGLPLGSAFGPQILLRALAAAVIGRMENLAVIFAASCGIGVLEVAILWNKGSGTLIDPVLFVVILGALLLQRRTRESPVDDQALSTWTHAATVRPVPRELARLPEVRWVFRGVRLLLVVALLALPALLDERYTNLAAAVVIYAIIAVSLVLLTGWSGEISLGQVAFVAIGSAAAGAANVHWHLAPLLSFLLAGVVGAIASVVIGLPALRIRGLFLSVTTLAFAVATSSYLLNHDYFGFLPDELTDRVVRRPVWTPFGAIRIDTERRYYYVAAAGLILVLLAVRGLQRSRVQRGIVATRDNERSAQTFGLSPMRVKLVAFALSGFFASFAGGLLVLHQQALGEQIFAPVESLRALTMVVVGGLGSVSGAIVGAVFVKSTEWFNVIAPVRFRFLFTFAGSGIGLLLVLWLLPGGFGSVLYGIRDAWLRFVARRRGIVAPALVTDAGISRPPLVRIPARLRLPSWLGSAQAHSHAEPAGFVGAAHGRRRGRCPCVSCRRRRVRASAGAVRCEPRSATGRDDRAPRHERRGQVHDAAHRVGTVVAVSRKRLVRRCRHHRARAAQDRGARARARTRRAEHLSVAQRRRQPPDGCLDASPRPRRRGNRDRTRARPLSESSRSARRSRRRAVGRSTADAHHRDVTPRRAEGADDRRAVARPQPTARRAIARRRAPAARSGRHRDRRRAIGEHRARHRRPRLLPREGHDPLPRPHRRPPRAP